MSEQVDFESLQRKVAKLEKLITSIHDQFGLVLDKFLSQRTKQVVHQKKVLQEEEDAWLTLLCQLKTCVVSGIEISHDTLKYPNNKSANSRLDDGRQERSKSKRVAVPRSRRDDDPLKSRSASPSPSATNDCSQPGPSSLLSVSVTDDEVDFIIVKSEPPEPPQIEISDYEEQEEGDEEDAGVPEDSNDEADLNWSGGSEEFSNHEEPQRPPPPVKRPTQLRPYTLHSTFPDEESALSFIKAENVWTPKSRNVTKEGRKVYFRCKIDRQCHVYTYYLVRDPRLGREDQQRQQVELYRGQNEHVHRDKEKHRQCGLPADAKELITNLFHSGISTPLLILKELKRRGVESIPKVQLQNYLAQLRYSRFGTPTSMRQQRHAAGDEPPPKRRRKKRRPTGRPRGRPPAAAAVAATDDEKEEKGANGEACVALEAGPSANNAHRFDEIDDGRRLATAASR